MKVRVLLIAAVSLLVLFTGCTSITPPAANVGGPRAVTERSYQLGRNENTYVGATMIRVRSYFLAELPDVLVTASHDFRLSGGFISMLGRRDQDFPVLGRATYQGTSYEVVGVQGYGVMIDPSGRPTGKVINLPSGFNAVLLQNFNAQPSNLQFQHGKREVVDKNLPYENYELVYSGRTPDAIRLAYREYSPDDLARQPFFQELTYPANQATVRFRNLLVEILDANAESISFRVLQDDQGQASRTTVGPSSFPASTQAPTAPPAISAPARGLPSPQPNIQPPPTTYAVPAPQPPASATSPCAPYQSDSMLALRCEMITGPDRATNVPAAGEGQPLDALMRCHPLRDVADRYQACLTRPS